ncbi:MAG: sigma-70 family RNA polymerase sigma factor [Prevotella sp.]|nr:sigma-70 family RNA polymerase sigma factor [Prevotella sp.]MBQ6201513.1 sigma-70 family RNA polymerase sigma factor [Prevotella sp.]
MPHVSFIGNEEQRLVKRLQEGDKTAAREFYTRYGGSLAGVCVRYIADEEDVKDVIQNALVHIYSHITDFKYRGNGSLEAWVVRIAVNESLKFLRTKVQYELLQPDYDIIDDSEDDPSVRDIPPDILREMLNRLPTGYRTVLNLYVFEGKSHQEIARLLGIKKDSSASQLLRAKSLLAQMIRKYNNNNTPRR